MRVLLGMTWPGYSCSMLLPDEIEEGEEEDPDEIDQGPVEGDELHGREEGPGEAVFAGDEPAPDHEAHADEDVQAVEAGHHEVEAVELVDVGIGESGGREEL